MNFMFDAVKNKAVGLVDSLGRLLTSQTPLHALDDPDVWRKDPAYSAPSDVDIKTSQRWIDNLMGVTRGGESIYKLVWNGDRKYWHKFYMQWNGLGQPTAPPVERPMIRYKVLRDRHGKILRDVFPPRWLILTRLEPEQYADTYKKESYYWAPEIRAYKQIRPDEPPKVFWLWWATVAEHNGYCCLTKEKNYERCYGRYAPPEAYRSILEQQKEADNRAGVRSVFEKIDSKCASEIADENTGYKYEMQKLLVDAEIAIENPMALLGIEQSARAGIDDPRVARQIVKDLYDRRIQEQAKLI